MMRKMKLHTFEIKHFPKDFGLDPALVIFLTFLCTPFVLTPPLSEISPIRVTAAPSVISDE